jgi:hypothetical protein
MRPLTSNEQFLLGVLALVAISIATIAGFSWITKQQTDANLRLASLKADKAEAEVALASQSSWEAKRNWLDTQLKPMGDPGVAQANLLQTLKDSATRNALVIQRQTLAEVQHGQAGVSVAVTMDAKGSLESVIRWINTFQSPTNLYAIESCIISMDADDKTVICTLQVRKFFKEEAGT